MVYLKNIIAACLGLISTTISTYGLDILHMDYVFKQDERHTGWIHYSFKNNTDLLLCLPSSNFIEGAMFQENLFVTNASGISIPYKGPITETDIQKIAYFIIQPGQKFQGSAKIGDYHQLTEGTYSIQHLSHAVECNSLKEGNWPFTPYFLNDLRNRNNLNSIFGHGAGVLLSLDATILIK